MLIFFPFLVLMFLGMVLKSTHLLSFLIALEFLFLFIFFVFVHTMLSSAAPILMVLFLLGVMGCESVVGLVFFVILTRTSSKDYVAQLFLFKF